MVSDRAAQLSAFWTAMQEARFDAACELYAPDVSLRLGSLVLEGKAAVEAHMTAFRRGFPDVEYTMHHRHVLSLERVIEEWSCTATHKGEFAGLEATGQAIRIVAATVWEFEGDYVQRERGYMDMSRTLVKIGALQRPTTTAGVQP